MKSTKPAKTISTWKNLQQLRIVLWTDEDGMPTNRVALTEHELELLTGFITNLKE